MASVIMECIISPKRVSLMTSTLTVHVHRVGEKQVVVEVALSRSQKLFMLLSPKLRTRIEEEAVVQGDPSHW